MWRLLCVRMWRRIAWQACTNISQEHAPGIVKVSSLKMRATFVSPPARIYQNTRFHVPEVWNPEILWKFKLIEILNDGVWRRSPMEIFWCFGETRCFHFQGLKTFFSESSITTFSGKPLIYYHWTLSHFPVSRPVFFYVSRSLRKKGHSVKTTPARPSDCDVVLTTDLFVGFS